MQNPSALLLSMLLNQMPLVAAYVVGLVICATRWSRHPRPAQLAFLGTLFLLIVAVGQPLVSFTIARQIPAANAADMFAILSLVAAVVRLTGYGFLLGAVFFGRAPQRAGFPMASVAATPPPRS